MLCGDEYCVVGILIVHTDLSSHNNPKVIVNEPSKKC
jgi:hypothetical protein